MIKWTAEGAGKGMDFRVFCDVRHTSVVRNMMVFRKGADLYLKISAKQGGTAGNVDDSSLTDFTRDLSGTFLLGKLRTA